jgi:hypothetical protein
MGHKPEAKELGMAVIASTRAQPATLMPKEFAIKACFFVSP